MLSLVTEAQTVNDSKGTISLMTLLFQNLCFIRPFGFLSKSSSAISFWRFWQTEREVMLFVPKHQLFLFGNSDLFEI